MPDGSEIRIRPEVLRRIADDPEATEDQRARARAMLDESERVEARLAELDRELGVTLRGDG